MCIQRSVWYSCTYWSLNVKPKIARLHFFVLSYVLIFYCNITNYHQLIISQFLWHSITFTGYFMRASSSAIISVFDTILPHPFLTLFSTQLLRQFSNLRMFKNCPREKHRTPLCLKNTALDQWEQANPYGYINFHL